MKLNRKQLIKAAVLSCLTASFTFSAFAESAIEEIIVTATKRQQTLQEVPVAVSVTGADVIEKAKIMDIKDLQSVVPSLRITQLQSSANTNFIIRGFGNGANNAGIEPSVGVFIDGVYRSRSAGAISDLPNLQRVEVLRGPQSTLFGKNASAGVISVITAKPSHDFGGSVEATIANYGATVLRADMTNGLTEDLAFSLSGSTNQRDGYYKDLGTGVDSNDRDRYSARGQLLWTPSDNTEFRLIADHNSLDEVCCGVANLRNNTDPATGGTGGAIVHPTVGGNFVPEEAFAYAYYSNRPSTTALEDNGISLQANFSSDKYDFVSITSQRYQNLDTNADSDFTSADILGFNALDQDIDTFSQEFRLSSSGEGDLDWLVGAYFFKEDVSAITDIGYGVGARPFVNLLSGFGDVVPGFFNLSAVEQFVLGAPAGTFFQPGHGTTDTASQDNSAGSLFAQFDWHLSDSLIATFGLNHTRDEKEVRVTQQHNDPFSQLDFVDIYVQGAYMATFGVPATPGNIAFVEANIFPGFYDLVFGQANNPADNALLGFQALQFFPPFLSYPNGIEDGKSKDNSTTYTVRLAYDVNDSTNVYVSAGTGFKATSWNLSRDARPTSGDYAAIAAAGLLVPNLGTGTRFAGPEDSKVFELGLKTKFDKGSLNIALFDQQIDGFQSNVFGGLGFNLVNAGKQSTLGFEFDGLYQATDNLTLTMAGTLLSAKYDSFVNGLGLNGIEDLSGKSVRGVHPVSLATSATYNIDFTNGMTGFLRGDYVYESSVQMLDNVPAELATRKENVLNASFGIETVGGWGFTMWGRNITNDEFLYSAFPSVAQAGSFSGYPSQPRTYGLTVKKFF